jgi:hypothetical protein
MSTNSREIIWGGRIMGADIDAKNAREVAQKAAREADRAEACVVTAYGRLWRARSAFSNDRTMYHRGLELARGRMQSLYDTREPAARRQPLATQHADMEAEASLKCRSCRKGRYAAPMRMIKLTEQRQITPYKWVHPDEER